MTNDHRTSDDIERAIDDERAQMTDTFNNLQRKFSVEAIVSDLGGMVRGQGGDLGRAISDTVGRNPAAVALVGVGLAWLLLGRDRKMASNASMRDNGKDWDYRAKRSKGDGRPDIGSGRGHPQGGALGGEDHSWFDYSQVSGNRNRNAQARNTGGGDHAEGGVMDRVRHAASDLAGSMSEAAGSLSQKASDLTARLSHGLEDLSEDARARIVSARRAAHEARLSSDAMLNRGTKAATGLFEDQPLVIGALAVALGAAIGGALPHSKLEDDTMGDSSDQLFADAQALYREERAKAAAALKTAAGDAKDEIREMGAEISDMLPEGKSFGDVVVDRTSDAAARVIGRATGDTDDQSQSKPRT